MSGQQKVYFECPHCGENVPVGAKVCRECGASDDAGWNEDDFGEDYDDPIYDSHEGFTGGRNAGEFRTQLWAQLVILAIIISFVLSMRLL